MLDVENPVTREEVFDDLQSEAILRGNLDSVSPFLPEEYNFHVMSLVVGKPTLVLLLTHWACQVNMVLCKITTLPGTFLILVLHSICMDTCCEAALISQPK